MLSLIGCSNPLGGDKSGSNIGSGYQPGFSDANFSLTIPFSAGTDSSYDFSDATKTELAGGVCRLKPADQIDNGGGLGKFGSAQMVGAHWDGLNNLIKLNTLTNNSELDTSWAPQYSAITSYLRMNGSGALVTGNTITATVGTNGTASNANAAGMSYGAAKLNEGITFDGVDDHFTFGGHAAVSTSYTVSVWMKPAAGAGNGAVFHRGNSGGCFYNPIIIYNHTTNTLAPTESGCGNTGALGSVPMASGEWSHVAITRSAATVVVYINGMAVLTDTAQPAPSNVANGQHVVGRNRHSGGGPFTRFTGSVDEVAIWSVPLSAAEVQSIYARQSAKFSGSLTSRVMDAYVAGQSWTSLSASTTLPFFKELPSAAEHTNYSSMSSGLTTDLSGVWHLNAASGTSGAGSVVDSSGLNHHGTPNGGITFGEYGIKNYAAIFNGSNSYIQLDDAIYDTHNQGTLAAWIYLHGQLANGASSKIFSSASGTDANAALFLDVHGVNASTMRLRVGDLSGPNIVYGDTTLHPHQWYHVTAKSDGATWRLYVNGVAQTLTIQSGANSGGWFLDEVSGTMRYAIGALLHSSGTTDYFAGATDEIIAWSRSLTDAEVLAIYRRGANRLKYQVRSCANSDCSDQEALTNSGRGWKGPDNSHSSYFSELHNNTSINAAAVPTGAVNATGLSLPFSLFSSAGTGLSVTANRYFQYRAVLESDDSNTLCNYGSGAAACSPELKTVTIGPDHYDTTVHTVTSKSSIGSPFTSIDANAFTESTASCSAGLRYSLSHDGAQFFYWDTGGSAWALSADTYATASSGSDIQSHILSFPTDVGTGVLQVKTFLKSDGSSNCQIDGLLITGKK